MKNQITFDPAVGKLGILTPGMGAVSTTFIAGVIAAVVALFGPTLLGVLEQRLYQQNPERWEYRLSAKGRDLFPLIVELVRWGDEWLARRKGPPMILRHSCGKTLKTHITCDQCHKPLTRDSTAVA